jgi:hypothetical protein
VKIISQYKSTKMKKNGGLEKDIQEVIKSEPLLNAADSDVNVKVGGYLKKIICLTGLACLLGIGLFFNGCMAGYVATEPSYMQYDRPPQPSNLYVWIDGDWAWNNQSHVYVQKNGYWTKPRQNQTYVSGHWQASPKGKSWVRGHWQKQNSRDNNRGNNRDRGNNRNR